MGWKEDFLRLYTSDIIDDYNKALKLKRENLPSKIYRYRTLSNKNIKLRRNEILNGTLYLSHSSEFNDPFEGHSVLRSNNSLLYHNKDTYREYYELKGEIEQVKDLFERDDWYDAILEYTASSLKKKGTVDEIKEKLDKIAMSAFEEFNNDVTRETRRFNRIACFSTTFKNLPMWHHYTNGHTGICLEYDTSKIKDVRILNRLFPVYYVNELIDATYLISHRKHPNGVLTDLLSIHKLKEWEYEDEWRLLCNPGFWFKSIQEVPDEYWDKGKIIEFIRPSKIILGKNISVKHEKKIIKYAEEANILVVKAQVTEYGLSIE